MRPPTPERRAAGVAATLLVLMAGLAVPVFAQENAPKAARKAPKIQDSFAAVPDEPGLPRVMLLGDSISMGYTIPVRELLKGKANVHRPAANCGETARGLADLDKWLGDGKWDVIHFNWGLHDLKYLNAAGQLVDPAKGKQVASPEVYEKNLRELVARLKKTGAKLIWASTTPVPQGASGRVQGSEVEYNRIAEKIMRENGVAIDDLHAVVEKDAAKNQLPKNVHFTPEGYRQLAESVARSIETALKS